MTIGHTPKTELAGWPDLDSRIRLIAALATRAEIRYRHAIRTYDDVDDCYRQSYPDDPVTAQVKAASDPRQQQASADAKWYRAEMQAYSQLGVFLLALRDSDVEWAVQS